MKNGHQVVSDKDKKRFQILEFIYSDTNGNQYKLVTSENITDAVKISSDELLLNLRYLENEGLIKCHGQLVESLHPIRVAILHRGVVEYEAAVRKPEESTEHFPAQIFNITNNATVSAQQFGNQNTLNTTQPKNINQESYMLHKIPLILAPQPEGGFTVTSPLLPELVTEGDTVEDALANVKDAFAAVVEAYEDLGRPLPSNMQLSDTSSPIWLEVLIAS